MADEERKLDELDEFMDSIVSGKSQDKAVESLASMAAMPAAYYAGLIDNGVPEELAYDLTMQWAHIFWTNSLSK